MKKRGISAVVATVLIILITVAAVTILWTTIIPIIKNAIEVKDTRLDVVIVKGFTVYDEDKDILSVQVKRGPDKENITKMRLIFEYEGSSESIIVDAPSPNIMRVYYFNLSNLPGIPDKVSVAPIFNEGRMEKEGYITSEADIPEGRITNIPGILIEVGCGVTEPTEISCNDGRDNDCDEDIDLEDSDCPTSEPSATYYWSFDTDMIDSISSLAGTPSSLDVTLGTAKFNNGLILDGNDDYVDFGNDPRPLFDSSIFTISFWFKKAPSETTGIIMSFSDATGTNTDDMFEGAIRPGASTSIINLTISEGTTSLSMASLTEIDNNWHHVVFVYDYSISDLSIYLDGNLNAEATTSIDIPDRNNLNLVFGCQKTSNKCDLDENAFNGTIDEVIIFNEFLTPQKVTKLYEGDYIADSEFNWIR